MGDSSIRGFATGARRATATWLLLVGLMMMPATLSGCRLEVEPEQDASMEPYVLEMLETSATAWNRGDLESFLSDYEDASSTTFVGSSGILSGVDQIREKYSAGFGPGAERDSLRFEDVRVRELSPLIGIVTARWVLYDRGVTRAAGPFTLVMRTHRPGMGWKIIHDHSSSDPAPAGD